MDIETTDFSIEKIINDIDQDLSFADMNKVDEDSGTVVYKKFPSDNGSAVTVMQLQPVSESDEDYDDETKNTTSSKTDENCSTNSSDVEEKDKNGSHKKVDTVNVERKKISPKKGNDDETVDAKNKKSVRRGEAEDAVDEEGEVDEGEKRKDVISIEDGDGVENESILEVCDYKVTTNDVFSSDDEENPDPLKTSHISSMPLPDVSVLIEKLDYQSVSKTGVLLEDTIHEQTDSGETKKSKKQSLVLRKCFNKLDSKINTKGNKRFSSDKNSGVSKHQIKRKRCIICFLSIDIDDYDEHVATHKASMIADNSHLTHRRKSQSAATRSEQNPMSSEKKSKQSGVLINTCSVEDQNKGRGKSSKGNNSRTQRSLSKSDVQKTSRKSLGNTKKNSPRKAVVNSEESLFCEECKISFTSSRDFRHHKLEHKEDKSNEEKRVEEHQCHVCQKTFYQKSRLASHVKTAHKTDEHKSMGPRDRKRKLETLEIEGAGKVGKNIPASSGTSQQTSTTQVFPATSSTGLPTRAARSSRDGESLVILPFVNVGSQKNVNSASSRGNQGDFSRTQCPEHIDLVSLGTPKEVRREIVRKYHKLGPYGDEEITETITEIW